MINSFKELNINDNLIKGLKKEGIIEPTEIQARVIPLGLENKDIVGQAETGSGKTLAYLLPIMQNIDTAKRETQCIILSPTHELAIQINNQIKLLSDNSNLEVSSTAIIGTASIKRQIESLKKKPHIVVGSTGRIFELIKDRKLKAHTVKTIVLDEGDRLLDETNIASVKDVIKTTLKDQRQMMLFSATMNEQTLKTANELMKDPEIIRVNDEDVVNTKIEHFYMQGELRDKFEILRKLVASTKPKRAIVFINKSEEIDLTTTKLRYHKLKAEAIYGTSSKEDRKNAMDSFKSGKVQLLVSSDLSARGLNIEGVSHIFNLDLPPTSKEYIHRVGRTARGKNTGTAISIITSKDFPIIKSYEKELNIDIKERVLSHGKLFDTEDLSSSKKNKIQTIDKRKKK